MIRKIHVSPSALALVTALLGACSSTPVTPAAPMSASIASAPAPGPAAPAAAAQPMTAKTVQTVTVPAYLDAQSDISTKRSVYFDFDVALLKPDFSALIERQGKYLSANPSIAIKIEGNADERGSAAYNLALGQRRADTVRQALEVFGARDGQLEAISWGSERPRAPGHDEAAWAQNRRADLQYPSR